MRLAGGLQGPSDGVFRGNFEGRRQGQTVIHRQPAERQGFAQRQFATGSGCQRAASLFFFRLIEKLENGVDIGEKKLTMPAKVEIVGGSWEGAGEPEPGRVRRENLPEVYTELHLTIHEGKFHQVKRMMAAVETPVIYLKRISMGPLTLPDNLKKGECRLLTEEELLRLKG